MGLGSVTVCGTDVRNNIGRDSAIRFVAAGDFHFGWENVGKRRVPLHNLSAVRSWLNFINDYQPDVLLLMGDVFDCGEISHWNAKKKLSLEGLRLRKSIDLAYNELFEPLDDILAYGAERHYVIGNHEWWLHSLLETYPALEGLIEPHEQLSLEAGMNWKMHDLGTILKLGKLHFIHGESTGGKTFAYQAAVDHEKSIRVWHHHTFQAGTKKNSVDARETKTGIGVPGMCNRAPSYGKGQANNWCVGFNWGEVDNEGYFTDHVTLITERGFRINGKKY